MLLNGKLTGLWEPELLPASGVGLWGRGLETDPEKGLEIGPGAEL